MKRDKRDFKTFTSTSLPWFWSESLSLAFFEMWNKCSRTEASLSSSSIRATRCKYRRHCPQGFRSSSTWFGPLGGASGRIFSSAFVLLIQMEQTRKRTHISENPHILLSHKHIYTISHISQIYLVFTFIKIRS